MVTSQDELTALLAAHVLEHGSVFGGPNFSYILTNIKVTGPDKFCAECRLANMTTHHWWPYTEWQASNIVQHGIIQIGDTWFLCTNSRSV